MDSLFLELKEKVLKEKNLLSGLSLSKYEYYTVKEISDVRISAGKLSMHKILPDSISEIDRPKFLESFDSKYEVDRFGNFIRKGHPSINSKKAFDIFNDKFIKFWKKYLENDIPNFIKGNKWEYVDTNSLYLYENRYNVDGLEVKIDLNKVDFNGHTIFSAALVTYRQSRPVWEEFPLTDDSQSSLKYLLGFNKTDRVMSQIFSDGRFYLLSYSKSNMEEYDKYLVNPNTGQDLDGMSVEESWMLHWDKKTKLLRFYNQYTSEYLILKLQKEKS